jgi:hypothetical protein
VILLYGLGNVSVFAHILFIPLPLITALQYYLAVAGAFATVALASFFRHWLMKVLYCDLVMPFGDIVRHSFSYGFVAAPRRRLRLPPLSSLRHMRASRDESHGEKEKYSFFMNIFLRVKGYRSAWSRFYEVR